MPARHFDTLGIVPPKLRFGGVGDRGVIAVVGIVDKRPAANDSEHCLAALEALGIVKSHVDVLTTNVPAQAYWQQQGWMRRDDTERCSLIRSNDANA